MSSPSSANDACLLFVESEFFWTFYVCWKASVRSIQVLLYVPCVFCLQRFVACRQPLVFSCPWSIHPCVRSAFRDVEIIMSTERSQFLLACTDSQKKLDLHADVKAALVLAAVMSLSRGGLRHRRRRLLRHLGRVRQDRRRRAQLRQWLQNTYWRKQGKIFISKYEIVVIQWMVRRHSNRKAGMSIAPKWLHASPK